MRCRILWGLTGPLSVQPMLMVSVDHGRLDEAEAPKWIADIARKRRPKPAAVDVLGGNIEPGVLIRANEMHLNRDKPPAIVKWLEKRIRAEFDHGDYYFEIVQHERRTA